MYILQFDGKKELLIWVNAADDPTKRLFTKRGYVRSKFLAEHMCRRFFSDPMPDSAPKSGYTVRALCDESEGLRRAQRLGATLATVSSYGKAAHALYESMGFTEFDLLEPWIKEW